MNTKPHFIGVDLGGTNIRAGVVDASYNIVARARRSTNAPRPAPEIVRDIIEAAREAAREAGLTMSDISSLGVGSPGSVNPATGCIDYSNNLGFTGVPLRDMLETALGLPARIANDANAAAYGEFLAGAGRGTRDFVAITLGTGVGGGVIIDSKLYTGYNHAAGELGHTVIVAGGEECTCGRRGCAEAYVSATALTRMTRAAMGADRDSAMWALAGSPDNADGKIAFEAAQQGDASAKRVVDDYLDYLAVAVTNYVNIFQPERLSVGGGVAMQGENLLVPLRERVHRERYTRNSPLNTEIVASRIPDDAGIIGAAMLRS